MENLFKVLFSFADAIMKLKITIFDFSFTLWQMFIFSFAITLLFKIFYQATE